MAAPAAAIVTSPVPAQAQGDDSRELIPNLNLFVRQKLGRSEVSAWETNPLN
jgi:hypothetical protein